MSFRCEGVRSVNETMGHHFKKVLETATGIKSNVVINTSQNYSALAELGIKELGHQKAFDKWLNTPKIALGGGKTNRGYQYQRRL